MTAYHTLSPFALVTLLVVLACNIEGCPGSRPVRRKVIPVSHSHSSLRDRHLEQSGFASSPGVYVSNEASG